MAAPTDRSWSTAALCALLFLALGLCLVPLGGLGYDEVYHAQVAVGLAHPDSTPAAWPWMPLMRSTYQGALKSYLLYVPFKLFGAGVLSLRLTTLILGAGAVFFLALLGLRLHGRLVGGLWAVFLATDPSLLLSAVYDAGPSVLSVLLKAWGLWLLAGCRREPRLARRLGLSGLLFGLALWDKSHFLWFLAALPLSALLLPRASLRPALRRGNLLAAAAGLLIGAGPWLAFNLLHGWPTFTHPESLLKPMAEHWASLGWVAQARWGDLRQCLSGEAMYRLVAHGDPPGLWLGLPGAAGLMAAAILGPLVWRGNGWGALRPALFWLLSSLGILLAAVLSPAPVKFHHLYALYPLPHLALTSLMAAAQDQPRLKRRGRAWALALTLLCLLGHGMTLGSFHRGMARNGGSVHFFAGMPEVTRWMEEYKRRKPEAHFAVNTGLDPQLRVYSQGRLSTQGLRPGPQGSPYNAVALRDSLEILRSPHALLLLRRSGGPSPETALEILRRLGAGAEPLREFPFLDGKPLVTAYRVHNPFLAPLEQARRLLGSGRRQSARAQFSKALRVYQRAQALPGREGLAGSASPGGVDAEDFFGKFLEGWKPEELRVLGLKEEAARRALGPGLGPLSPRRASAAGAGEALGAGPDELRRIALRYQQAGEFDRCSALLGRLLSRAPGDPGLWADKGICESLAGRTKRGIGDLVKSLSLQPAAPEASLSLGALYARQGRPREALAVYERALGMAPRSPEKRRAYQALLRAREELLDRLRPK